jgi:N-acetylmuramic acid 6-phosphate etherase
MSTTEDRAARFTAIDAMPTVDAVAMMLEEQIAAVETIRGTTHAIAAAAEAAADRLRAGGRLIYAGAGTSGRLGALDGVELGPTFGWPHDRLVLIIAGGMDALIRSAEGAEDDGDAARDGLIQAAVGANDVLISIAASGRTPFAVAAIETARAAGALTIAIANNPDTPLLSAADHALLAATGSEVIAGSTRMKAGTAQKAIVNMLSTAIMLRLGRVHRGLMVDMQISNEKLLLRGQAMVQTLAGCSAMAAASALTRAGNDIKAAVLIALGDTAEAAVARLAAHDGMLGDALAEKEAAR